MLFDCSFCATMLLVSDLMERRALDVIDGRLTLLTLEPQSIVTVAPAENGGPLDICAVHTSHT